MSIVISNAFTVIEGRPVTSSRIVAEYFGKQHKDTLRAIRDLIADAPELERKRNFALTEEEQKIGATQDPALLDGSERLLHPRHGLHRCEGTRIQVRVLR